MNGKQVAVQWAGPEPPAGGASSSVFWIGGLDCADCAAKLEKRIAAWKVLKRRP